MFQKGFQQPSNHKRAREGERIKSSLNNKTSKNLIENKILRKDTVCFFNGDKSICSFDPL